MTRLLVHVEGETEENFVNEILCPYLVGFGFHSVSARLLGNARNRLQRGGIVSWPVARQDIKRHLRGDAGCVATTMVDFYALPSTGNGAWPGRENARLVTHSQKATTVEVLMHNDIVTIMGNSFNSNRFVPYVMMHEFEALLFSDCQRFGESINHRQEIPSLQEIRDQFGTPEEINDSPITAPSKRLLKLIPSYQKTLHGPLAVSAIGLEKICDECPHFREWIDRLRLLV